MQTNTDRRIQPLDEKTLLLQLADGALSLFSIAQEHDLSIEDLLD